MRSRICSYQQKHLPPFFWEPIFLSLSHLHHRALLESRWERERHTQTLTLVRTHAPSHTHIPKSFSHSPQGPSGTSRRTPRPSSWSRAFGTPASPLEPCATARLCSRTARMLPGSPLSRARKWRVRYVLVLRCCVVWCGVLQFGVV